MRKKAEFNMWWLVIGGLVALVLAVIMIVILTEGSEKGQSGLFGCLSKGGICKSLDDCLREGETPSETFECAANKQGEAQVCCFKGAVV